MSGLRDVSELHDVSELGDMSELSGMNELRAPARPRAPGPSAVPTLLPSGSPRSLPLPLLRHARLPRPGVPLGSPGPATPGTAALVLVSCSAPRRSLSLWFVPSPSVAIHPLGGGCQSPRAVTRPSGLPG
ncbi:hypothetical protein GCM10010442_31830 [Kitasatospora kifunensis]